MAKAAAALRAGQTAIFEDGAYLETETVRFTESGTAAAPIVVKARHRHQARLVFQGLADREKLIIDGASHVSVEGFDITQDAMGRTWGDVLVRCSNAADHCRIIGNAIHGAMEALKAFNSSHVTVADNLIYNTQIGIGAFDARAPVIRGNTIINPVWDGIQTKGGTRRALVDGNLVRTTGAAESAVGIYLGGSSESCDEGCGVSNPSGYEAYQSTASNNVIVAGERGSIEVGLFIQGCHTCTFQDNVVSGTQIGIATQMGGGIELGWERDTFVRNPAFVNNVISDCTEAARHIRDVIGFLTDSNRYTRCPDGPGQF